MHKEKRTFALIIVNTKKNERETLKNETKYKTKKREKNDEILKKNMSKAHQYKRMSVHSLLPVIVVANNVP